jgi:hypothetical protein
MPANPWGAVSKWSYNRPWWTRNEGEGWSQYSGSLGLQSKWLLCGRKRHRRLPCGANVRSWHNSDLANLLARLSDFIWRALVKKGPARVLGQGRRHAWGRLLAAAKQLVQFVRELRVGLECRGHCSCISLCGRTAREVDRRPEPAAILDAAGPFTAGIVREAANCESKCHGVHQAARMRDIALSSA